MDMGIPPGISPETAGSIREAGLAEHRYCGACGSPTEPYPAEGARSCPRCGRIWYPPATPAVITLITRREELLLARNARFPEGRYSLIAGFVEPGETLEEAVRREIREEVGLEVSELVYRGSQPWPAPHSLMVGFTARWVSGAVREDGREILHADWFPPQDLPDLPPRGTISRWLIDRWLDSTEKKGEKI